MIPVVAKKKKFGISKYKSRLMNSPTPLPTPYPEL